MKTSWKRFLLLQVLVTARGLGLAAQAPAFCLSGVPMRRDQPDEPALAALNDSTGYRMLLFGGSTTRNATVRYALGAPGEVGNLSTNAFIGLSGSLSLNWRTSWRVAAIGKGDQLDHGRALRFRGLHRLQQDQGVP